MAAHLLEDVDAIDDRHVALDEHDIGRPRQARADRLHAVRRGRDREARAAERRRQPLEQARLRIGDDDADLAWAAAVAWRCASNWLTASANSSSAGRTGSRNTTPMPGKRPSVLRLDLAEAVRHLAGRDERAGRWAR